MLLFGYFLKAVAQLLGAVIGIFIFLFIARAILSWVSPDPRNPIVQFINNTTEPILSRVRSKIPPLGMFDLSVLVVILVLYFLDNFLVGSIRAYGELFLRTGNTTVTF